MSDARRVHCSLADYHGDKHTISHSGLELVLEDPANYEADRLLPATTPVAERKKHYRDGQAFEDAIMRPGPCGGDVLVIPDDVLARGGVKAGRAWEEFKAAHRDKVLVRPTDDLYNMIRAVQDHETARQLIEADGRMQETIYWHDDEFDVECRIRIDKIFGDPPTYTMDLKTDASECSVDDCIRSIEKWGYDRQAEFYMRGIEGYYARRTPFVFVFVSKTSPWRVQTIELDEDWYPVAKVENDRALRKYAKCKARGTWKDESHGKLIKVKPRPGRRAGLEVEDG